MFADTLGLIRPRAIIAFDQNRCELWNIGDVGNLVFAEIGRGDFTLIFDQLLHQARADRHDRFAVDLSLVSERIDDRADIVGRDEFVELHSAGFRVDFDLRDLGNKRSRRSFARHFGFDTDRNRRFVGLYDISQCERFCLAALGGKFSRLVNHLIFGAAEQCRRLAH